MIVLLATLQALTIDDAVGTALQRNRDLIAARLEVEAAQLDRVQAGLYPNPTLSYTLGNVVVGTANSQGSGVRAGAFDETVHTLSISDVIDVWAKRNAHIRAANRGIEYQKIVVEDALREISYAVRSAFGGVVSEQWELQLAKETRSRYDETIRLSRARFSAGDISEAELRKIELEGARYQNDVIDAEMELDLSRQKLAALMGLRPSEVPPAVVEPNERRTPLSLPELVQRAMRERPDVRATLAAQSRADAELSSAKRDALPDISLGLGYTHSNFTVSGDNPDSLYLNLSLPLPIFDRNQANIGRARLHRKLAENDQARLQLAVEHEVADAVRRSQRAQSLLAVFEGGMIDRAESALKVAEKSYKAGAVSLLELLEAQRTYIETRARYLRARRDLQQGLIDVTHAVGGEP
ncbi:MAG: TolC family protein [Methanothrix sp.]|nr:TolC family protein [Methanothrix sp.]